MKKTTTNVTLIINDDFFKNGLSIFVLNNFAVRANSKFQFVLAAVSEIHSQTVTTK